MINTKAHALVDYLLAFCLGASPWLFGFSHAGIPYQIALTAAAISFSLAATTRFEYALVKLVPLRLHLYIDIVCGIALALSPWLFSFSSKVFKPHLVLGLTLLIVALLTDRMLYSTIKTIRVNTDFQRAHQRIRENEQKNKKSH